MAEETPSITHKYIPRVKFQRENNLFIEEYYSSTDTHIYIDDEEQTEIGYIGYSLQEQLKPLYGYASYTYDDMAVGNRIVTGMFKIPIKNTEAQATLKETVGTLKDLYNMVKEYNKKQQEMVEDTEWVDNTDDADDSDSGIYDDDDESVKDSDADELPSYSSGGGKPFDISYPEFITPEGSPELYDEYMKKLMIAGYDVHSGLSDEEKKKALKKFQMDYGLLDGFGLLTDLTMSKLDELYEKATGSDKIRIEANTYIYTGPSFGCTHYMVGRKQTVTVKTRYDNGWAYVYLDSGGGYIYLG